MRKLMGMPCKLPDGVLPEVLMSACASTQMTPRFGYLRVMPATEPTAMLWSPPRISGKLFLSAISVFWFGTRV